MRGECASGDGDGQDAGWEPRPGRRRRKKGRGARKGSENQPLEGNPAKEAAPQAPKSPLAGAQSKAGNLRPFQNPIQSVPENVENPYAATISETVSNGEATAGHSAEEPPHMDAQCFLRLLRENGHDLGVLKPIEKENEPAVRANARADSTVASPAATEKAATLERPRPARHDQQGEAKTAGPSSRNQGDGQKTSCKNCRAAKEEIEAVKKQYQQQLEELCTCSLTFVSLYSSATQSWFQARR